MSIDERLSLECQYHRHESTQARLAGRLKSACCRRCGSVDGMQAVHRDTLIHLKMATVVLELAPWFSELGNTEYLFYLCPHCNLMRHAPDGYKEMIFTDILDWLDHDPMAPDYAALAAEPEAATAGRDSRESAGL